MKKILLCITGITLHFIILKLKTFFYFLFVIIFHNIAVFFFVFVFLTIF